MSTLSDLQKKLQEESEGIMFPFRTATVSTTQPVLDTATDGIMSVTGKKYIGPDSVIQYSPEGQRQLKEIEKGMLPQFDQSQFPDIGKGKVEDRGGAAPLPIDTTPLPEPEGPTIDPCPPGFKYDPVKKICVPVEQPKSDRDEPVKIDPRKNIGDVAEGLDIATKALQKAKISSSTKGDISVDIDNGVLWLNFIPVIGKPLNAYQKNIADEKLKKLAQADGITVTTNPDGTQKLNISDAVGKRSYGQLQTKESLLGNMASTQKLNAAGTGIEKAPNGQNMIVGPITLDYFGKGNLFQPTTRTPAETDALNAEEKNKLLSELNAALGLDSTVTAPKPVTVDPESTAADATARNTAAFGEVTSLDKSLQYFGQLNRDKDVLQMQIDAIDEMLAGQNVRLPQVKAKYAEQLNNKKTFETKLKNVENEITKAEQDAKNTEEKLAKSDRQTAAKIASDYNSRVGERAEKRQKEFEEKQRIKATKSPEQRQKESKQRTENFKKMTQSIRNFNRR